MDDCLSNALAGLAVESVVYTGRRLIGLRSRAGTLGDTAFDPPLLRTIADLEGKAGVDEVDRIAEYLRTSSARALFSDYLIAAMQVARPSKSTVLEDNMGPTSPDSALRSRCEACLRLELHFEAGRAHSLASHLHRTLKGASRQLAEKIVQSPSSDQLLDAALGRLAQGTAAAIKNSAKILRRLTPADLAVIQEFEQDYAEAAAERFSRILPPSWNSRRHVPIDDVYVRPDFDWFSLQSTEEPGASKFTIDDISEKGHRLVVLGDPGGGKSTLTIKLAHILATRSRESEARMPFRIVLRDLAGEQELRVPFLKYIESELERSYHLEVPEPAIEYYLATGRAAVFFDGLDELTSTEERSAITEQISTFSTLFPQATVVVTSRTVGYGTAPLPSDAFDTLILSPFSVAQTQEYAGKWFHLDGTVDRPSDPDRLATSFIVDSEEIPDLRSNGLLLALLCNIYSNERHIPRNRPEVYERCASMLFDRWDRDRGITSSLAYKAHTRHALGHLAAWMLESKERQRGVKRAALINEACSYFLAKRFGPGHEAESEDASNELIEFCTGRAWVLTDVGDEIYGFTHRTFLEYFAANHLCRTYSTVPALWEVLYPRLADGEWDIVGQLCVGILDDRSENAASEVLTCLALKLPLIPSKKQALLLNWYFRCLSFVVIDPVARNILARAVADVLCEDLLWLVGRDYASSVLLNLSSVPEEGIRFITDSILRALMDIISDVADGRRSRAARALLHLDLLYNPNDFSDDFALAAEDSLTSLISNPGCRAALLSVAKSDPFVASALVKLGLMMPSEFAKLFSFAALFGVRLAVGLGRMPVRMSTTIFESLMIEALNPATRSPQIAKQFRDLVREVETSLSDWENWTPLMAYHRGVEGGIVSSRLSSTEEPSARALVRNHPGSRMSIWFLTTLWSELERSNALEAARSVDWGAFAPVVLPQGVGPGTFESEAFAKSVTRDPKVRRLIVRVLDRDDSLSALLGLAPSSR